MADGPDPSSSPVERYASDGCAARAPTIVVIGGADSSFPRIVRHAIQRHLPDASLHLILEDRSGGRAALRAWRRRLVRLGLVETTGQVLFLLIAYRLLARRAGRRVDAIMRSCGLDGSPVAEVARRVASVNSRESRDLLGGLGPSVVVVCGTTILRRETLASVSAPFLNVHFGITPHYRGHHGGYWALADGRPELVGTTVHLIDDGIDVGDVVEHTAFRVEPEDSIVTYPFLHIAAGLPSLMRALSRALSDDLPAQACDRERVGPLRYHPTIWGYVWTRIRKGVK